VNKLSFIIFVLVLMFPLHTQAQDATCGLPTRFAPGQIGRVLPGAANKVRTEGRRGAKQTGQLPGRSYFRALDGSACSDGFTWRQIEYGQGRQGWTAEANASEYFVELSPFSGNLVSAGGVSLVVPGGTAAVLKFQPGEVDAKTGRVRIPPSVNIRITGDSVVSPSITIYRTDAYDDGFERGPTYIPNMFEGAFEFTVDGLRDLLKKRPDLAAYNIIENRPPDLSPGVAPNVLAYRGYLDFQNGSGYRMLTQYAQDTISIGSKLYYRFNGLTNDHRYLVQGDASVTAPRTPTAYDRSKEPSDSQAGLQFYQQYADGVETFLNGIPANEWTPNLDLLDTVMRSLIVDEVPMLEKGSQGS
jgi:hypothetical protein